MPGPEGLNIILDTESCCGNRLCQEEAPDLFGETDYGEVPELLVPDPMDTGVEVSGAVPEGLEDQAKAAERACPVQAIFVEKA